MHQKNMSPDRIFVSYRRDDTQGYAGRLEDSLAAYFGTNRVFRDVGGIEGGIDFAEAIEKELSHAGAIIALIGRHWLTAGSDGQDRLGDDNDYVSMEIATALDKGIPVVPVLVENAIMPREEELPDSLRSLARRNAVSISDEPWSSDITRLAKTLAIDVPGSVAEMKLARLKIVILALLFPILALMVSAFTWAAYRSATTKLPFAVTEDFKDILMVNSFSWAIPSASFVAIVIACFLLMLAAKYMDASKARFISLSIWVGGLGTLGTFIFYGAVKAPGDIIALFAFGTITIAAMLVLMTLSGFKPR